MNTKPEIMLIKIDHARRQKNERISTFLENHLCPWVRSQWLNSENIDLWLCNSILNVWSYNYCDPLFGSRIKNCISKGFVCDSPRNGGSRGLDYPKKVQNIVLPCTILYHKRLSHKSNFTLKSWQWPLVFSIKIINN